MAWNRAVELHPFLADHPGISVFSKADIFQIPLCNVVKGDQQGQRSLVQTVGKHGNMEGNVLKSPLRRKNITHNGLPGLTNLPNVLMARQICSDDALIRRENMYQLPLSIHPGNGSDILGMRLEEDPQEILALLIEVDDIFDPGEPVQEVQIMLEDVLYALGSLSCGQKLLVVQLIDGPVLDFNVSRMQKESAYGCQEDWNDEQPDVSHVVLSRFRMGMAKDSVSLRVWRRQS